MGLDPVTGFILQAVISVALSAAVNWLFPRDAETEGPRVENINQQSSSFGASVKKVYGEARIAGTVFWSKGIKEHKKTSSSGGKGGGGSKATTYTYTCSFAVGLCEGEITGVRRIWANSELIYDASDTDDYTDFIESLSQARSISIYTGATDQLPDPLMEAVEGSGNVPAYRDLAYIVFEDFDLTDFGARIPNLEFEVLATGEPQAVVFDVFNAENYPYEKVNYGTRMAGFPGGYAVVGEPTPSYATGFDVAFIDGAPGQYIGLADTESWGNANGNIHYSPATGYVYVWSPRSSHTYAYSAMYRLNPSVRDIEPFRTPHLIGNDVTSDPLAFHDRCDFNTFNGGKRGGGSIVDLVVDIEGKWVLLVDPYSLSGTNRRWPLVYKFSALMLETCQGTVNGQTAYPEIIDFELGPIIDFDGVNHTTEQGTSWGINKNGSTHYTVKPFGVASNGDICYYSYPGNFIFITDGYSTDIKKSWDKPSGINSISNMFLDEHDRMYFTYNNYVYVCNILDPTVLTSTTDHSKMPIASILADLFKSAGLEEADYDVSDLTSKDIVGYVKPGITSTLSMIEPLMQMFQFDTYEQDWQLICRRRQDETIIDIPYNELGAIEYGSDPEAPIATTRKAEREMPWQLLFQYLDYNTDHQTNSAWASRSNKVIDTLLTQQISYAMTMETSDALQAVETFFQTKWASLLSYKLAVSGKYIDLIPGQVITIDGGNKMRVNDITLAFPNLITIEATSEDSGAYVSVNTSPTPNFTSQSISALCMIAPEFMGLPALESVHSSPGFYLAISAKEEDYKGAILYRSLDSGSTWDYVDTILNTSVTGTLTSNLLSGETNIIDQANTIEVQIDLDGDLSSTTLESLYAGYNTAAIGAEGRWEIISFQDVTANGGGHYTLKNLVRGRCGTDAYMSSHTATDSFILLEQDKLSLVTVPDAYINQTVQYKVVTNGATLQATMVKEYTCEGMNLETLSPDHVKGARSASGDLTITWIRRSRSKIGWNTADVPIVEETESYEIDFVSGNTVLRTEAVTNQTAYTYTATDQTTDFGSPQASLKVRIYQISGIVGRGHEAEAVI